MTIYCTRRTDCGKTWPRDPVLEVRCPTCQAPVGRRCKRPSGHACEVHVGRDRLADRAGHYGACPLGICGTHFPVVLAEPKKGEPDADHRA